MPISATALITIGAQELPVIISDVEAFLAWLQGNNTADDNAQIAANAAALKAAIAEETAKAAGGSTPT